MTLQLFPGERLYIWIEAKTFATQRKKFLSKIDKDDKVTIYTYTYDLKDSTPDGIILNRSNAMLIGPIPKHHFQTIISVNLCFYPEFEILFEKDYSHMSSEDAFEEMKKDDLIVMKGIEKVDSNEKK